MINKIAEYTLKFRILILALILVVTVVFGYFIKDIKISTDFDDLMSHKHDYIKTFKQYREKFGGANDVYIVLETKEGDIFNSDILNKVRDIQQQLHLIPGVNHYQVISLASSKLKVVEPVFDAIETAVLMEDVPQNEKELVKLKKNVKNDKTINGVWVSVDGKATLIKASFHEKLIDYPLVFNSIKKIINEHKNDRIDIYAVGHPMVVGYIYDLSVQTYVFLILSLLGIIAALYFYFRYIAGVLLPLISAFLSATISLSFFPLFNISFDPLFIVIPFLITARTISHTVQMMSRFGEEYVKDQNRFLSAKRSLTGLFAPGVLGTVTDAAGIFLVAVAPIPILQKLALTCGLWVLTIIVSVVITIPILLTLVPVPKRMKEGKVHTEGTGIIEILLAKLGVYATGRGRWGIVIVTIIIVGVSAILAKDVTIGESKPGSPLLWSDHEYNTNAIKMNKRFLGFDNLIVILEGDPGTELPMINPGIANIMENFQHTMQFDPNLGGSGSYVDVLSSINKIFHNGDPKWELVNDNKYLMGNLFYMFLAGSDPGDFESMVGPGYQYSMINFFYRDHVGSTVGKALSTAKEFIAGNPLPNAKFRLAGGIMGVHAAMNEVVANSELLNLALIFAAVFFLSAFTYQSFYAGLILIIPLGIAQILTNAFMAVANIGINVNTLPVASLGVGIGVDYGIYILSRIKEEIPNAKDMQEGVANGIRTTGRAIFFTATTLSLGVIFWAFSPLRFQAEMGLLLFLILIFNMLGAMIIIPTLISIFTPKFMRKKAMI
ncbi:MAG: MMPL family transporter [Desulfobacterales bacterium]|jgi:predicted RND superfamily exporter protein|nr:MMPL family transporter [Desulfobacterales bacterium]